MLNSSDTNLRRFHSCECCKCNSFTAITTTALADQNIFLNMVYLIMKLLSGKDGENLGVRGLSLFDHETLKLNED